MLSQLVPDLPVTPLPPPVLTGGDLAARVALLETHIERMTSEHNRFLEAVRASFETLNRDGAIYITDAVVDLRNTSRLILPSGNFTPGISFGGASVGMTTSRASGIYINVAGAILATGIVTLSAKGASTGIARIKNLPVAVFNDVNSYSAAALHVNDITFTGMVQGYTEIGQTTIALTEATAGGGAYAYLNETDFTNTSEVLFTVFYRAAG